jgi:hypothetical protein
MKGQPGIYLSCPFSRSTDSRGERRRDDSRLTGASSLATTTLPPSPFSGTKPPEESAHKGPSHLRRMVCPRLRPTVRLPASKERAPLSIPSDPSSRSPPLILSRLPASCLSPSSASLLAPSFHPLALPDAQQQPPRQLQRHRLWHKPPGPSAYSSRSLPLALPAPVVPPARPPAPTLLCLIFEADAAGGSLQGNNYDSRSYRSGGQGYHYSLAHLPLPFHRPPLRSELTPLCRSAPRVSLSFAPPRPLSAAPRLQERRLVLLLLEPQRLDFPRVGLGPSDLHDRLRPDVHRRQVGRRHRRLEAGLNAARNLSSAARTASTASNGCARPTFARPPALFVRRPLFR